MAIVVPARGTVVLRDDGSVTITGRDRATYVIDAELIAAIAQLLANEANKGGMNDHA